MVEKLYCKLKGRKIEGYDILGTRPTMDRVKESIFGMIQNNVSNSIVLDLFSGSGNYGIECISNGASYAYFNDYNIKCVKVIKNNIANMNIEKECYITNLDYTKALDYYRKENIQFDIVFLDPPYKEHIINNILDYLVSNNLLKNNGLVICEFMKKEEYVNDKLILFKEKRYGEKYVFIYKYGN